MALLIFLFVVACSFRKPILGLALLLQTNIIRSLAEIEFEDPCYGCINEPDILLGAVTPILSFAMILLRIRMRGKIIYIVDVFDLFFIATIAVIFLSSLYSGDLMRSFDYSFRYLLLGCSYFFIGKIVLLNSSNFKDEIKRFLNYSFWLAIIFGTFAGLMYLLLGEDLLRLSIPGVHPIPFSQLLGLGIFASFVIFVSSGKVLDIRSKYRLNMNKIMLPFLILLLLATNTRGIMLSVALAIFLYLWLSGFKVKKSVLYISGSLIVIALIVAVNMIDTEVLFRRLLAEQTEKSVDDRFIAYIDSLTIFIQNPFGIGPNVFSEYSILPYPHNFFLEYLAYYGVIGLIISLYFIVLCVYMLFITFKRRKIDITQIIIFCLVMYFLTETMFSFTLWMHKGLYLVMGFFGGYFYLMKKESGKRALRNA